MLCVQQENRYSGKDEVFMRRTETAGVPAPVGRQRRRRRKRRRRGRKRLLPWAAFLVLAALVFCFPGMSGLRQAFSQRGSEGKLQKYAQEHGYSMSDYPEGLIELYRKHPETEDYVFEYPFYRDQPPADELSDVDTSTVPLLMQWDQRWGYEKYAGNLFGLSGCGPTCLSMVAVYLTGDTAMTPGWMGRFASEHGYAVDGSGSAWALFSEGGKELGFDVTEIPPDEERIADNLDVNNPIVAVMGPGDFTTTGHFIVLTGYEDGKLKVNDPNSEKNSEKLWDYDRIRSQIRDLWVFRR